MQFFANRLFVVFRKMNEHGLKCFRGLEEDQNGLKWNYFAENQTFFEKSAILPL